MPEDHGGRVTDQVPMLLENPPVTLNRTKAMRRRHCEHCGHVQQVSSWRNLLLERHSCVREREGGGKIVVMVQWPGGA